MSSTPVHPRTKTLLLPLACYLDGGTWLANIPNYTGRTGTAELWALDLTHTDHQTNAASGTLRT